MERVDINRRYRQKRRKYRKEYKKRKRQILLIIFIIMLIVTGAIVYAAVSSNRPYDTDEDFQDYAKGKFDENQLFKINGKTEKVYEYGGLISYAADYDIIENENIKNFRDEQINSIKEAFKLQKEAEEQERAKENKDNKRYKAPLNALIVDSASYKSENGVVSLAIYSSDNEERDHEMVNVSSSLSTYLFSEETGRVLKPEQVFKENYREKCAEFFENYFYKTYSQDELKKDWKNYVTADAANFNKFVVTENDSVFFFDQGTVLKNSAGIVSAKMPNDVLGDAMRESVLERYIDPDKPMVALTYDDGPGGESEDRILNCLEKNGSVATFFYVGSKVGKNQDNVKRAQAIGCEIGNHTWNHPQLSKLPIAEAQSQITNTNEAIKAACGSYPTVFRPSYGDTNSEVNNVSKMPVIMWSIDTLDWKTRDPQKTFESVAGNAHLDGKIVLMHSIHDPTADATELIVPWLNEHGYQTVTVSELIKYKKCEQPQNGKVYR